MSEIKYKLTKDETRAFLIVSTRRVGSTALSIALNSHPDISCSMEIVIDGPKKPKIQNKHLLLGNTDSLRNILPDVNAKVSGSKVTIPDYQSDLVTKFTLKVIGEKIPIIHIHRPLLEQYVSLKHAQENNVWHLANKNDDVIPEWVCAQYRRQEIPRLKFDEIDVELFCIRINSIEASIHGLRNYVPVFTVTKREIETNCAWKGILEFLGVNDCAPPDSLLFPTTSNHYEHLEKQRNLIKIFNHYESKRKEIFED